MLIHQTLILVKALFKTVAYLEEQNLFQIWFQLDYYPAEFPPSQEFLCSSAREIPLRRDTV